MAKNDLTFANFICKFDTRPMVSYLREIVLPAFTDDTLIREAGEFTNFHLYDVKLAQTDRGQHIIYGQFIKNTHLSREQYFKEEKIIKSVDAIASSPSSFFLLIVDIHRLIYFEETAHAPNLDTFRATMSKFIRQKYQDFFEEQYRILKAEDTKNSRKKVAKIHPSPRVDVIRLSDPSGIEAFLKRYKTLQKLNFRILETNDDDDASELFDKIRGRGEKLGSKNTTLSNSNNEGLDLDEAIAFTTEATGHGYQDVRLSGFDQSGNKLTGDNDSFALRQKIVDAPAEPDERARLFLKEFRELRDNGVIGIGGDDGGIPDNLRVLFSDRSMDE